MNPNQTRSLLPNLLGLCLLWLQSFTTIALGQITPDQSLGAESSTVRTNVEVRGGLADRIEGGATRANNLFHSFSDFNVLANQRAYFSSPAGIQNILTRVTGSNASLIFGTLGVDGLANLFLMNPNGIVFGPNARLDIQGAFSASTGTAFSFGSQSFDARNPNAAPLVTVNIPIGIQFAADAPARLRNEGELRADRGLTLAAGSVDSVGNLVSSQGAVTVEAVTGDARVDALRAQSAIVSARGNVVSQDSQLQTTGNLTLQAGDTVRIRDSVAKQVAVNAGGDLVIQGNQGVDILALNHVGTPFKAGGNLTLVSDGVVSGDSHFASGGNFSILNQSENAGQFVSFYDPIVSATGNVTFGAYTGASLKIEATGSITATGAITINAEDTTLPVSPAGSDREILRTQRALILRSGVATLQETESLDGPDADADPDLTPTVTAAAGTNITIQNVNAGDGQVGRIILQSNGGSLNLNGANINANGGVTDISANTVTVQAGGTSFNGTVNFNGGTVGGGAISGGANQDTFNFNAGVINTNVNAGDGTDFFNFNGATISGTSIISGGDAIDTFTMGSGSIAADLQGNAGNDVFNLGNATFITATASIDGGANQDSIVGTNGVENFVVSGDRAGTVAGVAVSGIDAFEGGNGGTDTVTGTGGGDGFTIVDGNAATLNNIAFSQVEALDGETGNDTFTFNNGVTFAGTIAGGANTDRLDYSSFTTDPQVNLQSLGGTGIEEVQGRNTGNSTLIGPDVENTWTLDGTIANRGTLVNAPNGTITFIDFNRLVGGTNVDTFNLTNGGRLSQILGGGSSDIFDINGGVVANLFGDGGDDTFNFADERTLGGAIDGGAGTNTLNYSAYTTNITVDFQTPASTTGVTGFSGVDTVVGGSGPGDTVAGDGNPNVFTIANNGTEAFDGVRLVGIENIDGRGGDDRFRFNAGASIIGTVTGGDGVDRLDYSLYTTAINVNLATNITTGVNSGNANGFSGIEAVTGGASANDTLVGTAAPETFAAAGGSAGSFQFQNIETLDGGDGPGDVLEGSGGNDTFAIAIGVNQGTLNATTIFRNFETLKGQGENDTFNFTAGTFSGTVEGNDGDDTFAFLGGAVASTLEGGGGTNTISGSDLVNDSFTLVNGNRVNVNGTNVTFNQVQRLDGRLGSDSVVGTAADEVFSFGVSTLGGFQLNSIENLNGGDGNDTLEGAGGNDTFTITGVNSGCVAVACSALTNNFSNIENLNGLGGNDAFILRGFTSLSGNINGGDGDDLVTLSAFSSVIGTVAGDGGSDTFNLPIISSIGTLRGGADADTINFSGGTVTTARGDEGNDTFNFIAGTSNATVQGNDNDDTFNFAGSAVLNGTIDGGIGDNLLSYATYVSPVAVDLQTKIATGLTSFDNIQRVQGSVSLFDQISGTDADETFSFPNAGGVNGIEVSSFEVIDGRGGNDTFILNAGGTATTLFGGTGNDTIRLLGGTITDTIYGGSGILTIEGNTLTGLPTNAGSITGAGSDSSIIIQPVSDVTVGVNTSSGSAFNIAPDFFPRVNATTFRDMTIGRIESTQLVTIESQAANPPNPFSTPLNLTIDTTIRGGSIVTTGNTSINTRGNDLTLIANTENIDTTNNVIQSNSNLSGTDAGSIKLTANQGNVSTRGILARASGIGNGGDITLQGNSVNITLQNFDAIDTYSSGDGSTGNTSITANTGDVTITGQGSSGVGTDRSWANIIWADRRGAGISDSTKGNISITSLNGSINVSGTEFNLLIGNQSTLSDAQVGEGGGKLTLDAQRGQVRLNDSRIFTGTRENTKGNGANVDISSNSFRLDGNSILEATVSGSGQGGNIAVQSQSINITPGSSIQATVRSSGNAGTISLKGNDTVQIQSTRIETTVEAGATGNGGSVQIQGGTVTLEGTTVTADTAGAGSAGSVTIEGNRLTLDATTNLTANTTGTGQAGKIKLLGSGPGSVGAPSLAINGSTLSSNIGTGATGSGGSINIEGTAIALTDAKITASNAGTNTGSSVTIGTNDTTSTTLTDTTISTTATGTTTNTASIGNVTVLGQAIALSGSTTINAENQGAAKAGTVQIGGATTGPLTLTQTGGTSLISTQVTGSGSGSNVALNGAAISLTGQGPGTPNAIIDATTRSGNATSQGGSVTLNATGGNLQLQTGAEIKTTTTGAAQGGNISLTATGTVNLADQSQLKATSAGSGNGGSVTIQAANLALTQASTINTSTGIGSSGQGGDVSLTATGQISLKDAAKVNATTSGSGNAGDVTINATTLTLQGNPIPGFPSDPLNPELPNDDRSEIITRADANSTGAAGNITINATTVSLDYAALLADTRQRANSNQGNITISGVGGGNLTLNNDSLVSAIGSNGVRGGNITVEGFGLIQGGPVTGPNGSDFTTNADGAGQGGIILFKGAPINFRRQRSVPGNRTNDISSSGQIQLQDPGLEKGLKAPDVVFVDPNQLVGQDCQQAIEKPEGSSRFSIAGRGGVPANPTAPLAAEAEDSDWVSINRPVSPEKPVESATTLDTPAKSAQLVPRKDRQCISSLWSALYSH